MTAKRHVAQMGLEWSPLNMGYEVASVSSARGLESVLPGGVTRRRKVLIYGAGAGRDEAAPMLEDPVWEVWALNLIPPLVEGKIRADRWFDIHQRHAQTDLDMKWIAGMQVPIYVPPDLVSAGPMCVPYPLHQAEAMFGTRYWTCTFAYQIALAMMCNFEEIGLFGVELSLGTRRERTVEWACVSWWIGYAAARGVKVTVPDGSRLGHSAYRYGFEYDDEIEDVKRYVARTTLGDKLDDSNDRASVGG